MEQVKNAGQVALEMGNSASVVMKHYFEIVDASAAAAYWSIVPPKKRVPKHRTTPSTVQQEPSRSNQETPEQPRET
jgi:hypothetical protein